MEIDKKVMRSLWFWLTWVNFEHVQKNHSEDVFEQGLSEDSLSTWEEQHCRSTNRT